MRWPAALLASLLIAGGVAACSSEGGGDSVVPAVKIGGPFTLTDSHGRITTERDLLGKPAVVFFGFTYCPEICPTTLSELTAAMAKLGPDADRLNVVFISVDPKRDTPEQLKAYLTSFDSRIIGLTGAPEAIAATAKAYRVYYQEVALDGGGYTVDHSAAVYLFDKNGGFVAPVSYGAPPDLLLGKLRELAAG